MSVRMELLGFRGTDFDETWHSKFFRKSVQKIQVLLISDKNKRYFVWKHIYISDSISLNYS
jgi:hypothetical protein